MFSAPGYGGHSNDAAVMICDGEGVDIRTFVERQDKPFVVRGRQDGISLMMPRLQGLILDSLHNILKFSVSTGSKKLASVLSKSSSVDLDYIKRVIEASHESAEEDE